MVFEQFTPLSLYRNMTRRRQDASTFEQTQNQPIEDSRPANIDRRHCQAGSGLPCYAWRTVLWTTRLALPDSREDMLNITWLRLAPVSWREVRDRGHATKLSDGDSKNMSIYEYLLHHEITSQDRTLRHAAISNSTTCQRLPIPTVEKHEHERHHHADNDCGRCAAVSLFTLTDSTMRKHRPSPWLARWRCAKDANTDARGVCSV
jgi:hypothetical protein